MTTVRCYKPAGFRCRYLARCVIFTLLASLTVFVVYRPAVLNELQIIHFKHRQEVLKGGGHVPRLLLFNSTCSWQADQRGPHQKVIAYTIFGLAAHKYLNPYFTETVRAIPSIFPGKTARYSII